MPGDSHVLLIRIELGVLHLVFLQSGYLAVYRLQRDCCTLLALAIDLDAHAVRSAECDLEYQLLCTLQKSIKCHKKVTGYEGQFWEVSELKHLH